MPILDHFSLLAPLYERFIPARFPEELVSFLELPTQGAILDAGGGTGRLAQFLRGRGNQVVVADESLQMTLEARLKDRLNPVCSRAEYLPFAEHTFHRVIMVDAFHHVTHQAQTVGELWRVLAPGGILVIEEPDIRSFVVKLIALAEKIALMRSHFLSPSEIKELIQFPNCFVQTFSKNGTAWVVAMKHPAANSPTLVDVLPGA